MVELRWADGSEQLCSMLYEADDVAADLIPENLRAIYGGLLGGTMVGGCLKVALAVSIPRFHLYSLSELNSHPSIRRATSRDPKVTFFMDSANVWYYGTRDGKLFVFDSETDELDELGALEPQLEQLIREWQAERETK